MIISLVNHMQRFLFLSKDTEKLSELHTPTNKFQTAPEVSKTVSLQLSNDAVTLRIQQDYKWDRTFVSF